MCGKLYLGLAGHFLRRFSKGFCIAVGIFGDVRLKTSRRIVRMLSDLVQNTHQI